MKSAEIQAEIDNKNALIDQEAAKGQQTNHEYIIQLRGEITQLEAQLSSAKTDEASQQERVQAQTEKVESITLPLDFNDLLDNPLANEMIIEVVKQFQLQAYDEHNAELSRVNTDWSQKMVALSNFAKDTNDTLEAENEDLQKRIDAENEQAKVDAKDIADLTQQVAQLGLDKQDAEAKRDNAVTELEQAKAEIDRLNSHVFELQQQIASAPAPRTAIDITPNDRLADLAKQAKETAEQKAARGLARWNQNNPEHAVAPLEFPVLPTVANSNMEQSNPTEQVIHPSESEIPSAQPEANSGTTGNQLVESLVGKTDATTETALTLESLKAELDAIKADHGARLDNIERHANLPAVA